MNPWDLFLLVSLTVIFQKPLKAILKTDQENKPWMKIQPTCQPHSLGGLYENLLLTRSMECLHRKPGVGAETLEQWYSCLGWKEKHRVCTGRFPAKWKRPHGRSLTQPQPWSLAIFPFGFFFFPSVVWRNQMIYEQTLQHLQMKSGENFWMTFEMVWHI